MSPAERAPDGVFDAIHSRGAGAAAVTGEAWFAALLEVESALGAAAADAGLIDRADADAITAVCVPEGFDRSELASRAVEFATPSRRWSRRSGPGWVRRLRASTSAPRARTSSTRQRWSSQGER